MSAALQTYPDKIDLRNYLADEAQDQGVSEYNLSAMITCTSPKLESNEYKALVKKDTEDGESKWYLFDKGEARGVSDELVYSKFTPQILFWKKKGN